MSKLLFSGMVAHNKEEFLHKVRTISRRLGINPNWLMLVMRKESGLNHRAVNSITNATGLIQFMPATAAGLGTSVEALRNMSNVEQLDYVEKYYSPYRNRLRSFYDLYLATLFPAAIGKPDDWVLQTPRLSANLIARQNPGLDINSDGVITVGEVKNWLTRGLTNEQLNLLKKKQ